MNLVVVPKIDAGYKKLLDGQAKTCVRLITGTPNTGKATSVVVDHQKGEQT